MDGTRARQAGTQGQVWNSKAMSSGTSVDRIIKLMRDGGR
jgi:hypothetical protein